MARLCRAAIARAFGVLSRWRYWPAVQIRYCGQMMGRARWCARMGHVSWLLASCPLLSSTAQDYAIEGIASGRAAKCMALTYDACAACADAVLATDVQPTWRRLSTALLTS